MKKFLFDCGSRDSLVAPGLFFLRASVGLMMLIGHGIPKIQSFAEKKDSFWVPDFLPLSLMSPPVSMMAIMFTEIVASSLLVIGLMTRPAAFIFGFGMTVAAFGRHAADPWFAAGGPAKEMALLYLIPAVAILLTGAGRWSADAAIYKDGKRRRW